MRGLTTVCAGVDQPVIGMVHLRPLVGAPRFARDMTAVREAAVRDARALASGGVHGLMIENFGDAPFHRDHVPSETVAHMTALAAAVREAVDLPLGINVLRNDAEAALAIAKAVGAAFIRVNVLHGAVLADQGVIEGAAAKLMRRRVELDARDVSVLADVRVKHAAPLIERPLEAEVRELVERCGADALIVSGPATGAAVDSERLRAVKAAAGEAPVLVGSGVTAERAPTLLSMADGLIVGTHVKHDEAVNEAVDVARVRRLMERVDAHAAAATSGEGLSAAFTRSKPG